MSVLTAVLTLNKPNFKFIPRRGPQLQQVKSNRVCPLVMLLYILRYKMRVYGMHEIEIELHD